MTGEDRTWLVERALAAGFDLAGIAAVPAVESDAAVRLDARYAAWIAEGRAGGMEWLKRTDEAGQLVRGDVRRAFPWARSVLVCALEYGLQGAPRSIDAAEAGAGWIARYAWSGGAAEQQNGKAAEQQNGKAAEQQNSGTAEHGSAVPGGSDYHEVLLPRLKAVEAELKARFGEALETRCYVDTGPIVERAIAEWAGIGWVGKNACLLNQERGSWMLLGVIVTELELESAQWTLPAADRCGSCTRCIDACPTDALVAPRQMDASRCIAYLTIEHKGAIDEALREPMGRQVFGCDICQDVCPWNAKSARGPVVADWKRMPSREALINPDLAWLASMESRDFKQWFRGSPLERTGKKRLHRNVAIAMGNSGEARFVPQLETWAAGADEVLADAARWAMARIEALGQSGERRD
ncbi:epoxyqueuosine reductase [Bryocella elongata]|uniref:Epoxyqueuosine reductase n=1 Tax=Bryocella elongata TaxID=863522 RepID=A0A1H5SM66_9BACT|nr:tRNA epoxyqueuosine(34) reductase QueG [Bryocella elongata]SEF50857.1 epoxyqueuosine reductase [Bryocella elongata]